jgi:uncharacterized membrane protein
MRALARLPPRSGNCCDASHVDVLNRWFFAAFFGTALCCLVLAVSSFFRWHKPDAIHLLAGSLLYLVGTILVTILFNVPLNNGLAAVDPTSADAVQIWTNYVTSWTAWNHVRTAAALVAAVLFTVALCHASSPFESVGSQMSSPATSTILSDNFEGTKIGDSGNTVPVRNQAIEVLRGQPDGSWKLITGDPNGRK